MGGEDGGAAQPAGKAHQCQPGAGEPKCKETKASAAAATTAEVQEFPTAATAAEFPKLPATADLPTAADFPELWCTATATAAAAAAAIFDPPVCTACRICPPAGLGDKGNQMLEALGRPQVYLK